MLFLFDYLSVEIMIKKEIKIMVEKKLLYLQLSSLNKFELLMAVCSNNHSSTLHVET